MMPKSSSAGGANAPSLLGLPIRPMTLQEQQQLRGRMRAPAPNVLRVLGILTGVGAVLLAVTFFLGTPYDPTVFPVEVFLLGILAVGFAAGTSSLVRDPRSALVKGEVVDVSAPVVATSPPSFGITTLTVGPLILQVPSSRAKAIIPGTAGQLTLALGLRPLRKAGPQLLPERALLLSVNGALLSHPAVVRYGASGAPPTLSGPPPTLVLAQAPAAAPTGPPPGEQAFCARCGQPNAVPFQFCRHCGAPRS